MKPEKDILSTERPFLSLLIDWLLERQTDLPNMLVVVPTAQSGRRVRQGLAEQGAVLAPKVMTAGAFLQMEEAAPKAVEVLGWTEVLEEIMDWGDYAAILPEPPLNQQPGWALGLARAFFDLRTTLQENGLMISTAARSVLELEHERWAQLSRLESQLEKRLKEWGYQSKSSLLANGLLHFPEGIDWIVIAGVLDLPSVVAKFLEGLEIPVTTLVPHEDVDEWGRPGLGWNKREIVWPEDGGVFLTGGPSQQADLAVQKVAQGGRQSDQIGLGTGDEEVAPELVRSFGRAGWTVHDPGATLPSGLKGWLGCWRRYLQNPGVKEVIDMVAFAPSKNLVRKFPFVQVEALSELLDSHLVRDLGDVQRACELCVEDLEKAERESQRKRLEHQVRMSGVALEVMTAFDQLRTRFLSQGFHQGMRRLLSRLDGDDEAGLAEWLNDTRVASEKVSRSPGFWLDLLGEDLRQVPEEAPDERMVDVGGWLELLHDPAEHLVICGMNEGRVPSREGTDPWLPESARMALDLPREETRAARDAYLLHSLIEMRREKGRVDLIVGKVALGGDVLMPSRLLLTSKGETLAERVEMLFSQVEPADSGAPFEIEARWKWRPKLVEPKSRISVTAFAKYLACPFRYYLQRVIGMSEPEPERVEWNHRDFGNVLHLVLEAWGRHEKIRDSADPKELESWLSTELDDRVARQFGDQIPLAVSLQVEAMRMRLRWFAKEQAEIRASGWRITEVEKNLTLDFGEITVTGQIDRIECHDDGRVRVLDYKTSKIAKDVVKEHRRAFRSELPDHLKGEDVRAPDGTIWTNLQVPFYAEAYGKVDEAGYFAIGQDEANVKITQWEDFSEEDQDSARRCAEWIVQQVQNKVFWPPAAKVTYEDFDDLIYGRELVKAFAWEGESA